MNFEQFTELVSSIAHVPVEEIKASSTFRNDLGIDSLQMVNLLVEISQQTGVEFEHFFKAEDIQTVDGIYQTIIKRDKK